MNKYLTSAVERFDEIKEKNYLISPLSKNDVTIIELLLSALKLSGREDVLAIMQSYKLESDEEIIDQLTKLIAIPAKKSIKDVISDVMNGVDSELVLKTKYVIIKGERIPEWALKGYTYGKFWNHKRQEMLWTLTLNPQSVGDLKSVPLYINKQFIFNSQSEMMDVVKKLDMFLLIEDEEEGGEE